MYIEIQFKNKQNDLFQKDTIFKLVTGYSNEILYLFNN